MGSVNEVFVGQICRVKSNTLRITQFLCKSLLSWVIIVLHALLSITPSYFISFSYNFSISCQWPCVFSFEATAVDIPIVHGLVWKTWTVPWAMMIQKEVLHNLGILNARLELFIIIYFLVRRVGWRKAVTMFPKRCGFFHLTEFYLFYKEINFFLSFLDKVLFFTKTC